MNNYLTMEQRIARLEKILYSEACRTNELFGSLIGKVNATHEDAETLMGYLRNNFSAKEMDLETPNYGFIVFGFFTYKKNFYNFTIGEKSKDKICIELQRRGKLIDEVKGLRMNNSKIYNALHSLLENNGIDPIEIQATSVVNRKLYNQEQAQKNVWAEAEKEREQRELKKAQSSVKKNKNQDLSRQDWVDVLQVGNAWIIDPGRI